MPAVARRAKPGTEISAINQALSEGEVLGTILLPKNLSILSSRLPKPKYEGPKIKRYPNNLSLH